jgi:uncharacterized MnhB-related membrane protein
VSWFWLLDFLCLAGLLASAVLVVTLHNLSGAVIGLSAMGAVLAVLFLVLAAPDVAESEVVVGTIALPVLYLIAIGKIRTDVPDAGLLGESEDAAAREDERG